MSKHSNENHPTFNYQEEIEKFKSLNYKLIKRERALRQILIHTLWHKFTEFDGDESKTITEIDRLFSVFHDDCNLPKETTRQIRYLNANWFVAKELEKHLSALYADKY